MPNSDLNVERLSAALGGRALDVVVSGSIGAVESVRFIRALRRLSAEVTPHLTQGGAQFITETALSWAAGERAITAFSGESSHIATRDACIVAPASASFIAKLAHGLSNSPASALVTSYMGAKRPVILLPNMHQSLAAAPAVGENLARLASFGVHVLEPRDDEGKNKFPDPMTLADQIAHVINKARRPTKAAVVVTMGSTKGFVDDVRYISNYSSGALGSLISEELYRQGLDTVVISGGCLVKPRAFSTLIDAETNEAMEKAAVDAMSQGAVAAILAASVLDFIPKDRYSGKISSKESDLTINFAKTRKIIAAVNPVTKIKVGFKLETGLTTEKAEALARDYIPRYGLSLMVLNDLADVDRTRHKAFAYEANDGTIARPVVVHGKAALARHIACHVIQRI